jgi:hypothetical protein
LHGLLATGLADRVGHFANGLGSCVRHGNDGGRLALGLVDLRLLFALGAGDEGLALAGGDVDLLLATPFGRGDECALFALRGDLRLHRVQDLLGRREILDLVAQHLYAPGERGLVDGVDDLAVDDVALLESLVQFELADHAAQRRLRKLRDRDDVVRRAVARLLGVRHLEIQDAVHLKLRVVARDANLAGDIERHFLQAVLVRDVVDEGDQEVQARRERGVKAPEPLDDPRVLLRHDLDRPRDEDDGHDKEDDGDFH